MGLRRYVRCPNPDDATVVEFTETTELIKQAADGRCFQSSRKELHGTGCMVGQSSAA